MIKLQRTRYLSQIEPFIHDVGMIKVLTGMMGCGKSTILHQIMISLQSKPGASVAYLELDDDVYRDISTADQLRKAIEECFKDNDGKRYLFIDEIQNVEGFEKVVETYRIKDVSVFIAGSNSDLLSDKISTKLTGRYIEFRIMPFSFSEVEEYRKLNGIPVDISSDFKDYLIYGGLPKRFDYPSAAQEKYVLTVLGRIKKKDIMAKSGIKNETLLNVLISFLASTPGQKVSYDSITEFLKKNGLKVKRDTVKKYLDLIFSSNIASKCKRYDVVGKKTLNTVYKSYLTDLALHTFISGKKDRLDFGMLIENMIYNELISRGYMVTVGKKGGKEIDFVVTDGMRKAYIQAVYLMPTKDVVDREEGPLLAMKDGFPKYIVSMDPITVSDNGIIRLNLVEDFLLGDGFKL